MKINYIGLSCFLIENAAGYRILVDPFDDSPEWTLGPVFPKEFNGQPFGTNLLLISETDPDHERSTAGFQQNAPKVEVNSNPFPNLDLRGTLVHEWNGEVCIAWHYTVDGIRLAHFSDSSHQLTETQLKEIGNPDTIFYPLPKVWDEKSVEIMRKDIQNLNPKLVIFAHHLVPENMPSPEDTENLRKFFIKYFKTNASTNKGYKGEESFMELCDMTGNGYKFTRENDGKIINEDVLEINREKLSQYDRPTPVFFMKMLGN